MSINALDPIELFNECLEVPEPLFDEYYILDTLIISLSPTSKPTPIMLTNGEIIKRLTAAEVALIDKENDAYEKQVDKIWELLRADDDVTFIEFTSFWPSIDVSFSTYRQLEESEQKAFLKEAIRIFIKKRHKIYIAHGYTPTTIQVRKDFEKHKVSGPLGLIKARKLLLKAGFTEYEEQDFLTKSKVFCSAEKSFGLSLLSKLKNELGMRFSWQDIHQDKCPDLVLCSTTKKVFIVEMKHVKEAGGGQNKQIAELISFIKEGEDSLNISYVAFLDGIYFNELISPTSRKIKNQKEQILRYLEDNNKNANYFVNTHGFRRLINSI